MMEVKRVHLTSGLAYTVCGISDDAVQYTAIKEKVTCKRCKANNTYKNFNPQ